MKIPSLDKLAKLQGYLDARVVRDEKAHLVIKCLNICKDYAKLLGRGTTLHGWCI